MATNDPLGAGAPNTNPNAVAEVALTRRIVPSVDFVGAGVSALDQTALENTLRLSVTHFYNGLVGMKTHLAGLIAAVPSKVLPPHLMGTILQPGGHGAARLHIEVDIPGGALGDAAPGTLTADDGTFTVGIPRGTGLADGTTVALIVRGINGSQTFSLTADQMGSAGIVGALNLTSVIAPLPVSIMASLQAIIAASAAGNGTAQQATPVSTPPLIRLGEGSDDVCTRLFGENAAVDRFPFSVLFRLVEPRTSILNRAFFYNVGNFRFQIAARNDRWTGTSGASGVTSVYVDRVPIDQPISVDGFRDQLIGTGNGRFVTADESVPMAGTLGLGYVVNMAQRWTPIGVTLGNLVYSLPLAPGEQQRVAIFERREETAVFESETLSVAEQQSFQQQQDTSAQGTFDQAFSESAAGGSQFSTVGTSSSGGFNILIASGGGGVATSSGQTSSWMEGQRNVSSRAAEDTHASVERSAAARRQAQRTSMRLASSTESQDITTKVITNHNHTRALTLQYWEVQRLFDVTTAVDGVTVVCFVPLEVVRFLPAGQVIALDEFSVLTTRSQVLARYASVLKHADVLAIALPRPYLHGLELLTEFAADPRATVDTAPGNAEDVINISLHGGFLPFEHIYVAAVTRRGTRVGPVRLTGSIDPLRDFGSTDPLKGFSSEADFFGYLRNRRATTDFALTGSLVLPASLARADVVGFEISRQWESVDHTFVSPALQAAAALNTLGLGPQVNVGPIGVTGSWTQHFNPNRLEDELDGPPVWFFTANIGGSPESYQTNYINSAAAVTLPPGAYPVPALEVSPVLRYSALLQIEKMTQYVVRNTVRYSQWIWMSLTAEERVIMLEGFTIGVPLGGVQDDTQDVPLLNCVSNRVLGFYGNSMILPFIIPQSVAESQGISSKQLEDALTNFHRVDFDPPHSRIALPTRGVLGEAVLGHCPSAEKIDLTRFWNWQDSPADTATNIADVTLPTTAPSVAAGLQAPNTLTGMAPLITNFNNSPAIPVDTSLTNALATSAASQKDFTGLTNADQLAGLIKQSQTTAESARADALKRATELQSQAMTEIGNYFGATGGEKYAGNYSDTPQSGAAAGTTPSSGGASSGGTGTSTTPKPGTGGAGKPGGGTTGTGTGTGTGSGTGGTGGTGTSGN